MLLSAKFTSYLPPVITTLFPLTFERLGRTVQSTTPAVYAVYVPFDILGGLKNLSGSQWTIEAKSVVEQWLIIVQNKIMHSHLAFIMIGSPKNCHNRTQGPGISLTHTHTHTHKIH